ncbi:MAG: hypothetical protein PHT15_07320 [Gallionellaceae bacterium]|nr:hypothetical protein [Gallionellaceae bacterium]
MRKRTAAHALDQPKHRIAFLLAQGVAEDAPEQADVLAQWYVLAGNIGRGGKQFHHIHPHCNSIGSNARATGSC